MSDYSKINKLIQEVKFVMLTFVTEEGHLHAIPMTTQNRNFDGTVWFIGTKQSELVSSIPANAQVNLAYHISENDFVSINGTAELVNDAQKLDELWSPAYEAFFEEGKTDPNVQLIRVNANGAQYWESSGTLVTLFKLGKAAITGQTEKLGTTENINL